MAPNFNLQQMLSEMRTESNDRFDALERKLDEAVEKIQGHNLRLTLVEQFTLNTKRTLASALVTIFGALLAWVSGLFKGPS